MEAPAMATTFLRGLHMLELVDFHGSVTITSLARLMEVDKATASRMVSAAHSDGWVVRVDGKVAIGPRASMLGQSNVAGESIRMAEPLVHAVCGVTGLLTQAIGLIGGVGVVLATAMPGGRRLPYGLTTRMPLWAGAAGKVLASQMSDETVRAVLPEKFPLIEDVMDEIATPAMLAQVMSQISIAAGDYDQDPGDCADYPSTGVSTVDDLLPQLAQIRRTGSFLDRREIGPESSCIAVPWIRPGMVAAIACVSTVPGMAASGHIAERTLRAAASSGATRSAIVAAAAEA
jgi:DNA-binding IclR family transcriptional regulator